jgi:positive regulator of sigma E activity
MKWPMIIFLQSFMWGGYLLVEWISEKDSLQAKLILLGVFLYIAYIVAASLSQSKKIALFVTAATAAGAFLCKDEFLLLIRTFIY